MSDVSQETNHTGEKARRCAGYDGNACGTVLEGAQKQCRPCHREYVRGWRAGYRERRLTPEEWTLIQSLRAQAEAQAPELGGGRHRRRPGRPRLARELAELAEAG